MSQCTSVCFGERCTTVGSRPSMGSVSDAHDATAVSFFAMLECEPIDQGQVQLR